MEPKTEATSPPSNPLPPKLDARERQLNDDYEWCLWDETVRSQYAGKVVVAYHRQILGTGRNHREAWQAAEQHPGCPGKGYAAVVAIPG